MTPIVAKPFETPKPVIGQVTLLPLTYPGPSSQLSRLMDRAEQEALAWLSAGVDGVLIENTLQPFHTTTLPEWFVAAVTQVVHRLTRLAGKPVGLSLQSNYTAAAEAIAWATGAVWLRIPVASGCKITASGLVSAQLPAHVQELPLFRVAEASRDHWVPHSMADRGLSDKPLAGTTAPYADPLFASVKAVSSHTDAILIPAEHITSAWLQQHQSQMTRPLWIMDDGSLAQPDINLLEQVDGVILRRSVVKRYGQGPEADTIDPNRAQDWVRGFKQAVAV